jgi:hypothetical protein
MGFGWMEKGQIIIRQFFLPDFGREYLLFNELKSFFQPYKYLVSYNGKSYDYPLLRNRFLLNRQDFYLDSLIHLDLLHIARRIFKDSFLSCDLGTLERNLLTVERQNDIPGALIPHAYFNFIQTGVIHDIIRMINHNYQDIVTLARLLVYFSGIEEEPEKLADPYAVIRMAKLAFESKNEPLLNRISKRLSGEGISRHQIRFWESLMHKKNQRWQDAERIWIDLSQVKTFQFYAFEELVKFYEHIHVDLNKALEFTDKALAVLNLEDELNYSSDHTAIRDSFTHRKKRLIQKLC